MDTGTLVLIELALVFGLVAWFGFSQLRSLKRDRERKDENDDEAV